tara:strand:- start:35 stop:514 length:480 start_codon:yes stop_codon:yes gene_type:complete
MKTTTIHNEAICNLFQLIHEIKIEFGKATHPVNSELTNYINTDNLVNRFSDAIGIEPKKDSDKASKTRVYTGVWYIVHEIFQDFSYMRTEEGRLIYVYDTKDFIYANELNRIVNKLAYSPDNALICMYMFILCDSLGIIAWLKSSTAEWGVRKRKTEDI